MYNSNVLNFLKKNFYIINMIKKLIFLYIYIYIYIYTYTQLIKNYLLI